MKRINLGGNFGNKYYLDDIFFITPHPIFLSIHSHSSLHCLFLTHK